MDGLDALGVQRARVQRLVSGTEQRGRYVLYWMQSAQRVSDNHALAVAVREANQRGLGLLVAFCLIPAYPSAMAAHYRFMLEGLDDVRAALIERGIPFVIRVGQPVDALRDVAQEAACIVVDRGYASYLTERTKPLCDTVRCPVVQVETNVVVPVEIASDKQEYAARTIRRKIQARIQEFLAPVTVPQVAAPLAPIEGQESRLDHAALLAQCGAPQQEIAARQQWGGETQALQRLAAFCERDLLLYDSQHNEPSSSVSSGLSAYLHFGQISPVTVARAVMERAGSRADAFLEQLTVRRELAINYVRYCPQAGTYDGLPAWCIKTLEDHAGDPRPVVYTSEQLERAQTHDAYWNAAQREMVMTGRMHGYMRMYWGKKILEWTESPRKAFERALWLNDKYELDGRDPNGWVGVAWCFGLHDQPFKERPVFGKVRYMNQRGLDRKFDMRAYVDRVSRLEAQAHE